MLAAKTKKKKTYCCSLSVEALAVDTASVYWWELSAKAITDAGSSS